MKNTLTFLVLTLLFTGAQASYVLSPAPNDKRQLRYKTHARTPLLRDTDCNDCRSKYKDTGTPEDYTNLYYHIKQIWGNQDSESSESTE